KTLAGRTVAIDITMTDTVAYLKLLVQHKTAIPPAHQRLIYSAWQLDDDRTLSDYNVQSESTLHLVLRLRGGSASSPAQRATLTSTGLSGLENSLHVCYNNATLHGCAFVPDIMQAVHLTAADDLKFSSLAEQRQPPAVGESAFTAAGLPNMTSLLLNNMCIGDQKVVDTAGFTDLLRWCPEFAFFLDSFENISGDDPNLAGHHLFGQLCTASPARWEPFQVSWQPTRECPSCGFCRLAEIEKSFGIVIHAGRLHEYFTKEQLDKGIDTPMVFEAFQAPHKDGEPSNCTRCKESGIATVQYKILGPFPSTWIVWINRNTRVDKGPIFRSDIPIFVPAQECCLSLGGKKVQVSHKAVTNYSNFHYTTIGWLGKQMLLCNSGVVQSFQGTPGGKGTVTLFLQTKTATEQKQPE